METLRRKLEIFPNSDACLRNSGPVRSGPHVPCGPVWVCADSESNAYVKAAAETVERAWELLLALFCAADLIWC